LSTVNWNDLAAAAADSGFSTLPNGTYSVSVAKAEAKKTGTQKDKISVRFVVEDGPNAKASVFNDFVISPDNGTALGFFFRHMKALGLGPEFFATNPTIHQVAAALVGKRCQVEVSTRIWQEQERNQVDKILPPLGGQPTAGPSVSTGLPQPGPVADSTPRPAPAPAPAGSNTPPPPPF